MSQQSAIYSLKDGDRVGESLEFTYDDESPQGASLNVPCCYGRSTLLKLTPRNLQELGAIFLALGGGKIEDMDRVCELLNGMDLDVPDCLTLDL